MTYLCLFLALGTLIGTTFAAPTRLSDIQEDNEPEKKAELVEQMNNIAAEAKSQQDDESHARMQFLGNILKSLRKAAEAKSQQDDENDNITAKIQLLMSLSREQSEKDDDIIAAIESLPEEAQVQFLFSVGLPILGGLLGSFFNG